MGEEEKKEVEQPEKAPPIPEPKPPDSSGQGWSKEEQSAATRKLQAHAQLVKMAEQAGYDDVVEYVRDQDEKVTQYASRIEEIQDKEEAPPPKIPDQPSPTNATVSVEEFRMMQGALLKSQMTTDWREIRGKAKEAGLSKADLDEVLNDETYSAAIGKKYRRLDKEGADPNFYTLAMEVKTLIGGKKEAVKKGAEQQDELTKAEQTASVTPSTAAPAGKEKTDLEKLADDIAPDDVPYELPS